MSTTREVRSTCCYCGVGCGMLIETDGTDISSVRGDPDHPANFGQLCSKGSSLHLTARAELRAVRAQFPELRRDRLAARERVSWDTALDTIVDRFARIIAQHGPDAVAFYISGQLLTEDYYVFNKLAKGLIGTNNLDTNSRLCMSSAVAAYKQTLGADTPPCSYEDIDHADLVLIAGSNTAYAHPILYRRLEAARERNPELKTIVIDPRRTDTARAADLHLAILPGTDVALFNAMLHVLCWERLIDEAFIAAHTEGFEALKAMIREYTPKAVARTCGVSEAAIVQAAHWFGNARAVLSLYCQGLNQSTSGTANNAALINLHLATAQLGKPGAGPFSLTGQPNAMGGREVGGMANLLSAHRDMANPADRAEVAKHWGVDAVPAQPGKTAVEMFEAVRTGSIKAIWIACTNPAQSMPDQRAIHAALEAAELVVVQEAYRNTETARYADVLLPASSWGEKDGTVTNSERRISRVRKAIDASGEARADWAIARDFAVRLEARLRPDRPTLFPYVDAESVWMDHRASTAGRDLDITGLSYALLDTIGPQQWPMPQGAASGTARLYEDKRFATPSGKARFVATVFKPVADKVDARMPLHLNTGRLRDQWHAMSRTGTVARLFGHVPEPTIALHPRDLAQRGIASGELIKVSSRRGSVFLTAIADADVRSGQAFVPMHWGTRFLGGEGVFGCNTLTVSAVDPISKQPELKHSAIRIDKAELPWRLVAFGLPSSGTAAELLDALTPLMQQTAFGSLSLIGHEQEGVLLRLAHTLPPHAELLACVDRLFALDDVQAARYDDPRKWVGRRVAVHEGKLRAVRLSGALMASAAEPWLRDWLTRGEPVEPIRRLLLSPSATPPQGYVARGNTVCTCWNVTDSAINATLSTLQGPAAARLAALQAKLNCGTNCGSCVPELRRMVEAQAASSAASTTAIGDVARSKEPTA